MSVDVIIEDPRWADAGLDDLAEQAFAATLTHLGLDPNAWEVTVLGCDDARIQALNGEFRAKAQPTNVLSWPSAERGAEIAGEAPEPPVGEPELGDIALAFETCQREAAEQNKPAEQHFLHLTVHGLLHLLGYDHEREGDGDLMESVEIAILRALGVPNPYL
ncbi:MAG: rRNA maturation RNase YbeY [Paracoccaceae bacterium]